MKELKKWQSKVVDLNDQGMSYVEIGEAVGLAPSTVGDLAVGRHDEPRAEAAIKLDRLHRRRCKPAGGR